MPDSEYTSSHPRRFLRILRQANRLHLLDDKPATAENCNVKTASGEQKRRKNAVAATTTSNDERSELLKLHCHPREVAANAARHAAATAAATPPPPPPQLPPSQRVVGGTSLCPRKRSLSYGDAVDQSHIATAINNSSAACPLLDFDHLAAAAKAAADSDDKSTTAVAGALRASSKRKRLGQNRKSLISLPFAPHAPVAASPTTVANSGGGGGGGSWQAASTSPAAAALATENVMAKRPFSHTALRSPGGNSNFSRLIRRLTTLESGGDESRAFTTPARASLGGAAALAPPPPSTRRRGESARHSSADHELIGVTVIPNCAASSPHTTTTITVANPAYSFSEATAPLLERNDNDDDDEADDHDDETRSRSRSPSNAAPRAAACTLPRLDAFSGEQTSAAAATAATANQQASIFVSKLNGY